MHIYIYIYYQVLEAEQSRLSNVYGKLAKKDKSWNNRKCDDGYGWVADVRASWTYYCDLKLVGN